MYYIKVEDLISELTNIPKGTEISSIGTGYRGDNQYLTVCDERSNTIKQIQLNHKNIKEDNK